MFLLPVKSFSAALGKYFAIQMCDEKINDFAWMLGSVTCLVLIGCLHFGLFVIIMIIVLTGTDPVM